MSPLTVPEHTGLVGDGRRGGGPLAPDLDPGLDQRLIHPGGDAEVGNLPLPDGVELVFPIAESQTGALAKS